MAYEYTRETSLYDSSLFLCKPKTVITEDGIQKPDGYEKREVFARIGSLTSKEFYSAYQAGIQASFKAVVNIEDWKEGKELIVEFDGEIYNVYRTFAVEDAVELYCRKDVGIWSGEMKRHV